MFESTFRQPIRGLGFGAESDATWEMSVVSKLSIHTWGKKKKKKTHNWIKRCLLSSEKPNLF